MFIFAVILMTGNLGGYLAPAVNADEENNNSYPNNMSASSCSWLAGKSKETKKHERKAQSGQKETKKQGRKAQSGQLRSVPNDDVLLNSYITDVTASGITKIENNLYQATVELHFEIDTACIKAVTSAGYKFVYDLPDEVIIPKEIIGGGSYYAYLLDRYPDLVLAFTYDFIPTGGGHYRIEIVYDDDFVRDAVGSGNKYINNILS